MEIKRAFDFLYHQAAKYPKTDCLSYKQNGKWFNYSTKDVIDTVNRTSLGLVKLGVKKDDKVAIISPNRPEWTIVELAIQQIGAVSVPMYPTITIDDYKYIFENCEAKFAFVSGSDLYKKASQAIQGLGTMQKIFTFERVQGAAHWSEVEELGKNEDVKQLEPLKAAVQADDLLTLIYTSGTTGRPKGVMLSHDNIVSNAMASHEIINIPLGQARALSFLPLCHIYERTALYVYMYKGCGIYYAESVDTVAANLQEVKPHTFCTVPRLLEKVYDKIVAKGNALEGIKKKLFFWAVNLGLEYEPNVYKGWFYNMQLDLANKLIFSKWREALGGNIVQIQVGASALQPRLSRVFWAAGIKVCEGYGLTETSPVIAGCISTHKDMRIGCVGPTIPGVQVKIADDGEILCKGRNVMKGYYRNPEMTAEVIKDGWFHTGDIGIFVEGRFLKITDRKKEMFKTSGGKYIAPQVMENKFKECPLIDQLMVIGENQKFPAALIVPNFESVRVWCQENNITYTTDAAISKNADLIAEIGKYVKEFNKGFGDWEKIKVFKLMPETWSIDGGEMTPTLKLKRKAIMSKYEKVVEEIYAAGER
jgi:long-chain acyl-CoA synthetase